MDEQHAEAKQFYLPTGQQYPMLPHHYYGYSQTSAQPQQQQYQTYLQQPMYYYGATNSSAGQVDPLLMRMPHQLTEQLSLQAANTLLMSGSLDALAAAVEEPAKRDGEDPDINIDLGKELAGDPDEGTHVSKAPEEEGAVAEKDPRQLV